MDENKDINLDTMSFERFLMRTVNSLKKYLHISGNLKKGGFDDFAASISPHHCKLILSTNHRFIIFFLLLEPMVLGVTIWVLIQSNFSRLISAEYTSKPLN